jgi:ADP-heptose:LPS heptosyltransferase
MNGTATQRGIVPGVKKIAVLSPSAIGDFVVTLPAVHALKAAYPDAHIVYLGKAWHAELLRGRPGPIDEVVVVPTVPGVGTPADSPADANHIDAFIRTMQARRFDLAFQMYGGGRYSNPFIRQFGARLSIGLKAADAEPLDRYIPYVCLQNNRLRMLEVAALAGADRLQLACELTVSDHDRQQAESAVPPSETRPLILIHPGASDLRRRWPVRHFAAVADAMAQQGALVAVSGVDAERSLANELIACMSQPALNLCGRLPLSSLCGLLERAALVISNDTGPLHLALAIGTPCVGIYWFTNLYVAGPLMQRMHRAALSTQVQCPVCGIENVNTRCEHDVSFVAKVTVDEVLAMAFDLLMQPRQAGVALPAVRHPP